jgi:hypothetical protein
MIRPHWQRTREGAMYPGWLMDVGPMVVMMVIMIILFLLH